MFSPALIREHQEQLYTPGTTNIKTVQCQFSVYKEPRISLGGVSKDDNGVRWPLGDACGILDCPVQ